MFCSHCLNSLADSRTVCWQCGLIDLGLNNGKLNCEGQTVAGNSSEGALRHRPASPI